MKVLVTGGAGYVGAELVYKLSQDEKVDQVIVYDNLSRGNENFFISSRNRMQKGKVKFILGDLLDSRKLKKAVNGVDVVYHLAAKVTTPFENVESHVFEQVNNWGTSELVLAVEESESVKKLIYLSSASVFGSTPKSEPASEDLEPNPRTFYGISKMRGEEHIKRLEGKIETIIIRAANVYGYSPAIRFDNVINRFLFDSNFNNKIQIHGSGKQSRTFIHLSKLVAKLDFLKDNKVTNGAYNVGDVTCSVLDLVDIFKESYPELEFIFINQHLQLRNLEISHESKLNDYISLPESDLKNDLLEMKENNFAF